MLGDEGAGIRIGEEKGAIHLLGSVRTNNDLEIGIDKLRCIGVAVSFAGSMMDSLARGGQHVLGKK